MVNNTKLKNCLQSLAQSTLPLYNEHLPPLDEHKPLSSERLHIVFDCLDNLSPKVTENPEFSKCIDLMKKDKNIKELHGQVVGVAENATGLHDEKFTILSFLQQLYIKNQGYEQCLFDQEYSSFEELFYSDILRIRDTSRLHNFQFSSDAVELGHGLNIIKSTMPVDSLEAYIGRMRRSYADRSKSDFVIERLYDRRKIVGDLASSDEAEMGKGLPKTEELFDLVIASLRILKPSAVFRDHRISSELMTFHPTTGTSTIIPHTEDIVVGEKCVIVEEDIPELKKSIAFFISEGASRFNVAQRRLLLGMERKNLEDRLIDYMIGLEALYLPDGNQELSFRLSLRMSFLLRTYPRERKEIYKFAKDMYKARSNIVHGKKYKLIEKDITKLEQLLRESLKLCILDKNNFSTDRDSGILSNLFFKSELD